MSNTFTQHLSRVPVSVFGLCLVGLPSPSCRNVDDLQLVKHISLHIYCQVTLHLAGVAYWKLAGVLHVYSGCSFSNRQNGIDQYTM